MKPVSTPHGTHSQLWRGQVLRRMVFASNRNLIQSEAVLAVRAVRDVLPGTQQPKKAAGKQKGGKRNGNAAQPQQPSPAAAAAAAGPDQAAQPSVDHSQLPCEYHQAIVAGLSLASALLSPLQARVCAGHIGEAVPVQRCTEPSRVIASH